MLRLFFPHKARHQNVAGVGVFSASVRLAFCLLSPFLVSDTTYSPHRELHRNGNKTHGLFTCLFKCVQCSEKVVGFFFSFFLHCFLTSILSVHQILVDVKVNIKCCFETIPFSTQGAAGRLELCFHFFFPDINRISILKLHFLFTPFVHSFDHPKYSSGRNDQNKNFRRKILFHGSILTVWIFFFVCACMCVYSSLDQHHVLFLGSQGSAGERVKRCLRILLSSPKLFWSPHRTVWRCSLATNVKNSRSVMFWP